jgi:hypothetical protein
MNTDLLHKDIIEKIMGAVSDVHSFLSKGFQVVIYQTALAYEISPYNIPI